MANLFGKNKLKSVAQTINTDDILAFIDIVKKWHHDYHHGTLKHDKETSREQEYNQNFFKDILGYIEKPATPFSFEPKATTDNGQLPDAVISFTDKSNEIKNIAAVVELKGASIPLDRPQQREGNMSPIQQAFKYKTQYRNCPFVIVSNFYEFRLYRDNQLDYELWTLDDLVDSDDDYYLFKTWYVLLRSDNFIASKGLSRTEQLLSDIRIQQEEIGKKFYKVYREARLGLLRDIYANNAHVRSNIELGIEKSQKIIDRIVFAAFAEDRGLLPDNTLQRVVREAERSSFDIRLWQAFIGLFEAIDSGSDKLEIPDGYNGGLFKYDLELNNLKISDKALKPVVELSKYNFSEDLSVNILGHIFEQSISDLEEIKNKVNEKNNLDVTSLSRRKKDGIFYTPDYIVRYIVENSLGAYLREEEEKLKDEFGLKGDIQDKTYTKREQLAYKKYQVFLQNIKIIDPACGSGAFLVYVFDYLMAENQRVGDIIGNTIFSTDSYIRDILRNNIYGVDLNEESVEITKLSLWLKSAQKGKKLTSLDNNIKCGNSLIDDPSIAGDKAFNWNKKFSEVFKNGGFDVVVGNPPYVATKQISKAERDYFWVRYKELLFSEMDLYEIFTYKMIGELLTSGGYLGFITPNSYFTNTSFKLYRDYIIENTQIKSIVDFPYRFFPFPDVNTETAILITKKQHSGSSEVELWSADKVAVSALSVVNKYSIKNDIHAKQSVIRDMYDGKIIINQDPVITKMLKIKNYFGSKLELHKGWMSVPRITAIGSSVIDKGIFTRSEVNDYNIGESCAKYLEGRDIHRYYFDPVEKYVNISDIDSKTRGWHYNEKIILQRIVGQNKNKIFATYDSSNYIIFPNANVINSIDKEPLLAYLAILNSRLISYFYNAYFGESNTNLTKAALEGIPLPVIGHDIKQSLEYKSNIMLDSTKQLNDLSLRFQKLLSVELNITSWPAKLKKWWALDFNDFIAYLKIKLSLQQKDELLSLFEKYRTECSNLNNQIEQTDRDIDQLVYKLYNLSPEEIDMVKN